MLSPRRAAPATVSALVLLLTAGAGSAHAQVAGAEPVGGAAIGEIVLATGGAMLLTALLIGLSVAHRSGRTTLLARAGAVAERQMGIPGWAAFPGATTAVSLLVALLGMYWDISLHIDDGRDAGPLANPAHYLILGGLFGCFVGGVLAMVMPLERPGPSAVRITRDWHAPLGGVLLAACAAFSLTGFPLDDFWHRLFGQDVTLWGPTHLMLIGGAALTLIGRAVLMVEGLRARRAASDPARLGPEPRLLAVQNAALIGGFLIGLSTFQAEFDFGVPQFRFLFQPVLIALAAGIALVVARVWAGRGGALIAVAMFIAIRGLVALVVGPVLGETTPHLPLYIVEAVLVELLALRMTTDRPLAFGAAAGALIGSVGLAAEWGWSHVWMPIPWPTALLPEAALLGFVMAVAAGVIGGFIGRALRAEGEQRPAPRLRAAVPALAALVVAGVVGYGLIQTPDPGITARVTLEEAGGGSERMVNATVAVDPPSAASDKEWLTATAWQGGGFVVDRLERAADGTWRTTKPIPVHGEWKALIRLHGGDSLQAVPVFLPEDKAIPAKEVPAESSFTRPFVDDKLILQREAKTAAPWLSVAGYGVVLAITLSLMALLAWGLTRMEKTAGGRSPEKRPPTAAKRATQRPAVAAR